MLVKKSDVQNSSIKSVGDEDGIYKPFTFATFLFCFVFYFVYYYLSWKENDIIFAIPLKII